MQMIVVPALISLAITLLRLVGELQHWSPALFSAQPGGGGALVGISWLIPVFGIYFALKLAARGEGPASIGKALGLALGAVAALAAVGFLATRLHPSLGLTILIFVVA